MITTEERVKEEVTIGISPENPEAVANALSKGLTDSYVLYLKTRNYHWNVTGKLFHSLHEQFEEQYTELAEMRYLPSIINGNCTKKLIHDTTFHFRSCSCN